MGEVFKILETMSKLDQNTEKPENPLSKGWQNYQYKKNYFRKIAQNCIENNWNLQFKKKFSKWRANILSLKCKNQVENVKTESKTWKNFSTFAINVESLQKLLKIFSIYLLIFIFDGGLFWARIRIMQTWL